MSEDYYKLLGVSRSASQKEIEAAHRNLARKFHPDMNPDDQTAKKKFQEVQEAFDVLSDTNKREMYDRYGSSFESAGAGGGPGGPWKWSGQAPAGFEDIDFSQFFGDRFGGASSAPAGAGGFADMFSQFQGAKAKPRQQQKGQSIQYELSVPFVTAVTGGESQIRVQRASGKTDSITVKIPAGIEDGKKIRLRGQGEPSPDSQGKAGDILITVRVTPHKFFTRRGKNLNVKVPVMLTEAIEGAKIDVPTPHGTVSLSVPPKTSSGTKLRIKGHGVAPAQGQPGDLYAELQIVLPENPDDECADLIKQLSRKFETQSENPRKNLKW